MIKRNCGPFVGYLGYLMDEPYEQFRVFNVLDFRVLKVTNQCVVN